ncbi:hypothetical protein QBC36DRAFT_328906 [Triangularia setosa]|uniref:Uncharacterized protein n=1 Tax=Triangularia setosa TaxID=2587417 RepID=A0AAN7A7W8_9PEZI|nr:hypothetical protein QBC36DRAFT_328906 [Podospora setosa]
MQRSLSTNLLCLPIFGIKDTCKLDMDHHEPSPRYHWGHRPQHTETRVGEYDVGRERQESSNYVPIPPFRTDSHLNPQSDGRGVFTRTIPGSQHRPDVQVVRDARDFVPLHRFPSPPRPAHLVRPGPPPPPFGPPIRNPDDMYVMEAGGKPRAFYPASHYRRRSRSSSDDSSDVEYRREWKEEYKIGMHNQMNAHHTYTDRFVSSGWAIHHVDPLDPQDFTTHMSLSVQDDLQDLLEECSKFRRLGHFYEALKLFEDQLEHSFGNRYVLLQYGQCLFEAGQFSRLRTLAQTKWPSKSTSQDLLQLGWDMLLTTTFRKAQGYTGPPRSLGASLNLLRLKWPTLNSTEAQLLTHVIYNHDTEQQLTSLGNWYELYRHLVHRDMIWEYRDIFQQICYSFGVQKALYWMHSGPRLLGTASKVLTMISDWENTGAEENWVQDNSTLLALLDILATIIIQRSELLVDEETIGRIREIGEARSAKLSTGSLDCVMSRPYLRWSAARVLAKSSTSQQFEEQLIFQGSRYGRMFTTDTVFPGNTLPVYSPAHDESPRWEPKSPESSSSDAMTIRTILQAAEELGDLDIQAACLQQLLYLGAEPVETVIDNLAELWSAAGKIRDLREMHLFEYMLAHTDASRKKLRLAILSDGEILGGLREAQCMILRALAPTVEEKNLYMSLAVEAARDDPMQDEPHGYESRARPTRNRQRDESHEPGDYRRQTYNPYEHSIDRSRSISNVYDMTEINRRSGESDNHRVRRESHGLGKERREIEVRARKDAEIGNDRKEGFDKNERRRVQFGGPSLAKDGTKGRNREAMQAKPAASQGRNKPTSTGNNKIAGPQDAKAAEQRLVAIKREVEGIENDMQRAEEEGDTRRKQGLHRRMEELGMERYGLEQTRIKSQPARTPRSSSWPIETDRDANNGSSSGEQTGAADQTQANTAEEAGPSGTAETGKYFTPFKHCSGATWLN